MGKKTKKRSLRKMSGKIAEPPGSLIHIGEQKTDSIHLYGFRYDKNRIEESQLGIPCTCLATRDGKRVNWINITGLHSPETVEAVGLEFDLHSLIMEDILNTMLRPKQEDMEKYIFLSLKMLQYLPQEMKIQDEQVSFILGPEHVLTFQEREGDVFESVRQRLRKSKGRIRRKGADYLFYSLVDAVVDNYYLVLEHLGEEIENLEDSMLEQSDDNHLHCIHKLKRELSLMRKAVWPLREAINGLIINNSPLIKKDTIPFLRDILDHIIQIIDNIELYREMMAGLQELFLATNSNKMNEVMKVLTLIATIFIPLTFIAGVYGMNFEFMPELKWKYGYIATWGIMTTAGVALFLYFKRRKWM